MYAASGPTCLQLANLLFRSPRLPLARQATHRLMRAQETTKLVTSHQMHIQSHVTFHCDSSVCGILGAYPQASVWRTRANCDPLGQEQSFTNDAAWSTRSMDRDECSSRAMDHHDPLGQEQSFTNDAARSTRSMDRDECSSRAMDHHECPSRAMMRREGAYTRNPVGGSLTTF